MSVGYRGYISLLLLATALAPVAACTKTFRGSVSQPIPRLTPREDQRSSERVLIVTGDMELKVPRQSGATGDDIWVNRRLPLNNIASFTVVSRDRLRFHVQLEHKWSEWADLSTWDAYLVDDQGHRYRPEALDGGEPRHLVSMWDYETRSAIRNHFGDIVAIPQDGYKRRQPLASVSVFRGRGDFVFYARDIFSPELKRLTLVLERRGLEFSFTWKFAQDQDAGVVPGDLKPVHSI